LTAYGVVGLDIWMLQGFDQASSETWLETFAPAINIPE
jgi:hypothetical protein